MDTVKAMNENKNNVVSTRGQTLACSHDKDGIHFEYVLDLDRIKSAINADASKFESAMDWMNQAVISRGGSRWRAFLNAPDATAVMLEVLGSETSGRYKVTQEDRNCVDTVKKSYAMAPEQTVKQFNANNAAYSAVLESFIMEDGSFDEDALLKFYVTRRAAIKAASKGM